MDYRTFFLIKQVVNPVSVNTSGGFTHFEREFISVYSYLVNVVSTYGITFVPFANWTGTKDIISILMT
jgi:hypothetical protein